MLQTTEKLRVFVYGTLKPGEENYPIYCQGRVVDAVEAIAPGTLYDLPLGYPAMTSGSGTVQGYLLTFNNPGLLQILDELEDYHPDRPAAHNEYVREWTEVFGKEGRSLGLAWVYRMSLDQVRALGGKQLPEGTWHSLGRARPNKAGSNDDG